MIILPKTLDEALTALQANPGAELRAGGTDLQERRQQLAIHQDLGPVVDLRDVPGLDRITADGRQAWIGGLCSLQAIADHVGIAGLWPGVALACGALANPQIRQIATIAGNLMQAPRCWYYRHPDFSCLRKGGDTCFAREGEHPWHVCFDRSPCAAPHASTVAMALLAYDAEVEHVTAAGAAPRRVPVLEILDDGVGEGEVGLITAIYLPAPQPLERSAYVRASNRSRAEWALVEATVRLVLDADDHIRSIAVAVGAVAPKPMRLPAVEGALQGHKPTPERLAEAAALASADAKPLPQTEYKLALLEGTVLSALEQALTASTTPAAITTEGAM